MSALTTEVFDEFDLEYVKIDVGGLMSDVMTILHGAHALQEGFRKSITALLKRGELDPFDCLAVAPEIEATVTDHMAAIQRRREYARRRREFLENYPVDWGKLCDTPESRHWHRNEASRRKSSPA